MFPFQKPLMPSCRKMSRATCETPNGLREGAAAASGSVREWYCNWRRILTTSRGAMQKRDTRPAMAPATMTCERVPFFLALVRVEGSEDMSRVVVDIPHHGEELQQETSI